MRQAEKALHETQQELEAALSKVHGGTMVMRQCSLYSAGHEQDIASLQQLALPNGRVARCVCVSLAVLLCLCLCVRLCLCSRVHAGASVREQKASFPPSHPRPHVLAPHP